MKQHISTILRSGLVLALVLTTISLEGFGQEYIEVRGLILNVDTKEPLAFANVSSVRHRKGFPSDENGRFRFRIEVGDTLRVSFLGYQDAFLPIVDEVVYQPTDKVIELEPRVYELRPVTVRNLRDLPGFIRSDQKRDTLQITGLPDIAAGGPRNPLNYYKPSLGLGGGQAGPGFGVTLQGALTALLSNFDNYYKQLKKLEVLEARERQEKAIEKLYRDKFNPELVSQITKLQGNELEEFMYLYRPHPVFLASANEYFLTEYLFEKVELYRAMKKTQR